MNFYFFANSIEDAKKFPVEDVSGVLLIYNIFSGDFFSLIARELSNNKKNMTYIVAIRPYVISPQYLCMINRSIHNIVPNNLRINFITGDIKTIEEGYGGVIGQVNDQSSNIERSQYLIDYIDMLQNLSDKIPDYYVSVTNEYLLKAAEKQGSRIILPYRLYKTNQSDLSNKRVMVSITLKLRQTKEEVEHLNKIAPLESKANFTYDEFYKIVQEIESKGIKEMLITIWEEDERSRVLTFIKKYKKDKAFSK